MPMVLPSPDNAGNDGVIIVDPRSNSAQKEAEDFEKPDVRAKHLKNKQYEQDIRERKRFAIHAVRFTKSWICFLIIVTFIQQFLGIWHAGLSDGEFIAVVTTTTVSVLGFWLLVGRYLFPKQPDDKSSSQ